MHLVLTLLLLLWTSLVYFAGVLPLWLTALEEDVMPNFDYNLAQRISRMRGVASPAHPDHELLLRFHLAKPPQIWSTGT